MSLPERWTIEALSAASANMRNEAQDRREARRDLMADAEAEFIAAADDVDAERAIDKVRVVDRDALRAKSIAELEVIARDKRGLWDGRSLV